MRTFRADLHVHSRFSRATSSKLTVRHLAAWSMIKGLSVMATGDATHPVWREELRRDLVFDENSGLYRMREPVPVDEEIPGFQRPADGQEPLFLLQTEISSIYKKDNAVRKIHNLVFMPDLDSMDRLCAKLSAIGNLTSDGRPILGLDSEHLLDMVLNVSERGVLIPAHIWTPWFSLFGSKSGFDRLEDCFGSLSSHIFALETGLSSDPDMNRLWSSLDRYALVSNSDAHSGENLGREANLFAGTPTYEGLFKALRHSASGQTSSEDSAFLGTVEFFPEEGKYHLDGHRACNVVLEPEETRKHNLLCPVCGKPLTVGVLHRVTALADREQPHKPEGDPGFLSLIPLPELISELVDSGVKSRKVQTKQADLVRLFGSELDILHTVPESDLRQHWDELGEAVARMRRGDVIRESGYDGEYGVVRVFSEQERAELTRTIKGHRGSLLLPGMVSPSPNKPKKPRRSPSPSVKPAEIVPVAQERSTPFAYSKEQQHALTAGPHPVLVVAGPGSGKTRTLIGRVEHLLQNGTPPEQILAVTFTRRAAGELRERLAHSLRGSLPQADTLHSLAFSEWTTNTGYELRPHLLTDDAARAAFAKANPEASASLLKEAWSGLMLARERLDLASVPQEWQDLLDLYHDYKTAHHLADYTDLLEQWLKALQSERASRLWSEILVDEIQDLSPLQLALVRELLPDGTSGDIPGQGFFGIGDPDQAIYGFRGAQPDVHRALAAFWPQLERITLASNHRSAPEILTSASSLLGTSSVCGTLEAVRTSAATLHLFTAPDAGRESSWIAEQISRILGGTSHTLEDARRKRGVSSPTDQLSCSPGDIAILVRLKALIPSLRSALEQRGIPCAAPEVNPFWEDPDIRTLLEQLGLSLGQPFGNPDAMRQEIPASAWEQGPTAVVEALFPDKATIIPDTAAFIALTKAYREQGDWQELMDWVCLRQELDLVRQHSEQVQILTLHASKGLEFPIVFLPALEEGLLPFSGMEALMHDAPPSEQQLAEERRLLYVGLTRARDAVFASHASQRLVYGKTLRLQPSRFLPEFTALFGKSQLVRHTQTVARQASLLG